METISQYITLVLQREPQEGEAESWAALVDSGALTLDQVRQSIIDSEEAQNDVYPIILAYQAIYGRVPDAEGLEYWVGVYRANLDLDDPATPTVNEAMVAVLGAFVDPVQTPEFADRYGTNPNAAQFVTAAYVNVLDRAPDQEGLAYWTNRYNEVHAEVSAANPGWTAAETNVQVRAQVLEQFVSSVEYEAATEEAIDNYLDAVAQSEVGAYDGSLWSFEDDDTLGDTFTLTTDTDTIVGTDGNDVIQGIVGGLNPTFNMFDNIDGGEGTDTLNLYVDGDGDTAIAVPSAASIQNVEVVNFIDNNGRDVDAAGFTGVEQIWQSGDTGSVTGVADGQVIGFRDADVDSTVSYAGAVTVATIALEDIELGANLAVVSENLNTLTVNTTGVVGTADQADRLTIDSSGAVGLETLVINASSDIFIHYDTFFTFDGLTTFDASGSTGNVWAFALGDDLETILTGSGDDSIGFIGGEVSLTVDLGAGDDRITASVHNSDLTITLGEGADEVIVNSAAGVDGYLRNISDASEGEIESQFISITDFNGATDTLTFVGTAAQSTLNGDREMLDDLEQTAVAGAESLFEALNIVANSLELEAWTTFQYDNNTYIFQNDNTAGFNGGPGGAIDGRGDGVLELVGFTGEFTDANLVLA